jgi:hypothetical protein
MVIGLILLYWNAYELHKVRNYVFLQRYTNSILAAPENFELVRRLFFYRLSELHHQILDKENTFR